MTDSTKGDIKASVEGGRTIYTNEGSSTPEPDTIHPANTQAVFEVQGDVHIEQPQAQENTIAISTDHQRAIVGNNITFAVTAAPTRKLAQVSVTLDGALIYNRMNAGNSIRDIVRQKGSAGPFTSHTLKVTATDDTGYQEDYEDSWEDAV